MLPDYLDKLLAEGLWDELLSLLQLAARRRKLQPSILLRTLASWDYAPWQAWAGLVRGQSPPVELRMLKHSDLPVQPVGYGALMEDDAGRADWTEPDFSRFFVRFVRFTRSAGVDRLQYPNFIPPLELDSQASSSSSSSSSFTSSSSTSSSPAASPKEAYTLIAVKCVLWLQGPSSVERLIELLMESEDPMAHSVCSFVAKLTQELLGDVIKLPTSVGGIVLCYMMWTANPELFEQTERNSPLWCYGER